MSQDSSQRLARARDVLLRAQLAMGIAHSASNLQPASKATIKIPPGVVYSISGAQRELNSALVQCATPLSWIGVVALPEVGWERVEECGIQLEKVVVVPHPDIAPERVLGTLAAVTDVLCVGELSLSAYSRKRIAAKARQKGCTILSLLPWVGISRPFPHALSASASFAENPPEAVGI